MKWFYIRWGVILAIGLVIALFGAQRYYQEVDTLSPEQLLQTQSTETLRILGLVQPGSLVLGDPNGIRFRLSGEQQSLPVLYTGPPTDILRELKTLVVVGRWDPAGQVFMARDIALLPNYGYVLAAYLIGVIPTGYFLFRMERKVDLLYTEIKGAKVYEPEEGGLDKV